MPDEARNKRVRCRVVCHQYGQHFRGDLIEVEEREYRRVGTHVLLSKDDEEAQRREAESKRAGHIAAMTTERQTAAGWVEKEAEAARIVRARRLDEQRKQRELLVGSG